MNRVVAIVVEKQMNLRPAKWEVLIMKKLLIKYLNMKLRTKFMLSYIIIILITVLMIISINFKVSETALKNNTSKFSQYLIEQLSVNLDSKTKDVEDFIFLHFNNSGLNKHIRINNNSTDTLELYKKRRSIDDFLYNMLNAKQYIKSVLIIDKYGEKYFREKNSTQPDMNEILYNIDIDRIKNSWGTSQWERGGKDYVLVSRALFDSDNTSYLGLIIAAVDISYITKLYQNIDSIETGRIILLNKSNQVMLADDSISYKIANYLSKNNYFETIDKNGNFKYDNVDYISTLINPKSSKWKVLNVITVKELTKSSSVLKYWTMIACLIAFLIALAIAILLSNNITENIRLLTINIKKISEGNFNNRIQPRSHDEVGMLAEEFNLMSKKINTLIHTVYNEKLLKKNAEFKALQFEFSALQAQINPHFLYNTLETINSMAKLKGEAEISEMVYLLGNLLRDSISTKSSIIKLSEEINYIRNYLEIQKYMYLDKINVIYDIDENLMQADVPKFILQPIVENAIVHGLEEKIGKGTIIINCFQHDKTIVLEIIDNGIGISSDKILKILDEETQSEVNNNKHTKVGIKSVDKRIKILYGNEYGIKISSKPGLGTTFEIIIPLIGG